MVVEANSDTLRAASLRSGVGVYISRGIFAGEKANMATV